VWGQGDASGNLLEPDGRARGERRFVQGNDDVGGLADAAQDVVGRVGVDAGAGRNDLHFAGRDGLGREEVFPDDAKPGDHGRAGRRVHEHGHAALGMGRGVDHAQSGHDVRVSGEGDHLAGFAHILDIFVVIAVIQGMGIAGMGEFPLVDIKHGVFAQRVVFAVVVVQMGVHHHVDIGRGQAESGQGIGKCPDGATDGCFPAFGADRAHLAGVDQDAFIPALQVPAVNGDGVGLAVLELVGHHTLVEFLGAKDQGMDHEGGHA